MAEERIVLIPQGVTVSASVSKVSVTGSKGTLERDFGIRGVSISVEGDKVRVGTDASRKKITSMVGTIEAHLKNMIIGVNSGFESKLKIVFAHFPINTAVEGNKFLIKNFTGEKKPRFAKIMEGVKVEVKDKDVIITGIDKEKVGQTGASIERATKIKSRDPRIFQDGIFIVEKPRGVDSESKK
jgi:large subunit ribosomal protein L6